MTNEQTQESIAELVSAVWALKVRFADECYDEEQRQALAFANSVIAKYPQFNPYKD